jgi:hypothetical protein
VALLQNIADSSVWPVVASESSKALLRLGLTSLGGRLFGDFFKYVFLIPMNLF